MIISRFEFHRRTNGFNTFKEKEERMSVERLFKEIQADAPFRNHEYLFNGKADFNKLEVQESTVGIKKKFPGIKTEGERLARIKEEMIADTYEAVPVSIDANYPDIIYVNDGFHRIFTAHQLGYKVMRVKARYGKHILDKSIVFEDLVNLLEMLVGMFGEEKNLKQVKEFVKKILKKKEDNVIMSVGYGNYKVDKR